MKLDYTSADLQALFSAATNKSNSFNRMLYVNNSGMINKRGLSNEPGGTYSKPVNVDTPMDHKTISSEPCRTDSKFSNVYTHPHYDAIRTYLHERDRRFCTRTHYPVVVSPRDGNYDLKVIDFPLLSNCEVHDVIEGIIAIGADIHALSKISPLPEPTPSSEILISYNEYIVMVPID